MAENRGFAAGCNAGRRRRDRARTCFSSIPTPGWARDDLDVMAGVLDAEPRTALVGPRIEEADGSLAFSQRRFPRLRSTYAQALFLHRAWPLADWTDELVRDPAAYAAPGVARLGVGRLHARAAQRAAGDRRAWTRASSSTARTPTSAPGCAPPGHSIRYEPGAVARHEGGASAPRERLLALHAHNRVLYARKHTPRPSAVGLEAFGVALGHGTHALAALSSPERRRGHLHALSAARPARTRAAGRPRHVRDSGSVPHRRWHGAAAARSTCCAG